MRQPNKGRNQIENFAGNRRKSILQPMDMDQIVARLRSLSNISFASGPTAQFLLGDETSQIVLPEEQGVEVFFPFKIYNVNNISDPANTFRTYQVRSGIIGWRPYSSLNFFSTYAGNFSGNFEAPLLCPFDNWCLGGQDNNDPPYYVEEDFYIKATPNKGGNVFINPTSDTLIFSTFPDFNTIPPPQIVLGDSVAPPAGNFCALWIKIVDDPDVVEGRAFAQLWGRMFSPNGDGGRQTAPFPDSDPTIFPIGIISSPSIPPYTPWPQQNSANNYVLIEQLLSGNLVDRYPRDVVTFRGFWVADSLAGQVFYPGDQVADDSSTKTKALTSPVGNFTYTPVWVYVASSPSVPGSSPNVDSTDWVEVGSILA